MHRQLLLRAAVGAALAAGAFGAQAATMNLSSYKYGSNSVSVASPSYSGGAGEFTGTLTGAGALDGVIDTFCVELGEFFTFNQNFSDYNVVSAQAYFGAPSGKAVRLGRLISYVLDNNLFGSVATSLKDDLSTALQLAVWNIRYDTDSTLDTGTFHSSNLWTTATVGGNGFSGANALLLASQSWGVDQNMYVLQSLGTPGHQDQLFWRPTPPGENNNTDLPEPASLALVAVALAGAAVGRRRHRA